MDSKEIKMFVKLYANLK